VFEASVKGDPSSRARRQARQWWRPGLELERIGGGRA
jgi:hypothetical protein